jgi:hypothetical protein
MQHCTFVDSPEKSYFGFEKKEENKEEILN